MDTTNNLFGIHAAALSLREARLNVLASNLANADTPNYKARDIDFAQALGEATRQAAQNASLPGITAGATHSVATPVAIPNLALPSIDDDAQAAEPGAIALPDAGAGAGAGKVDVATLAAKYRIPMQPSLDGNTVDSDVEHAAFSRAALDYKATLSFVAARAKTLMTAITGT